MTTYKDYNMGFCKNLGVRIFYTIFIIKVLEALCFFSHGDALNYHLVGPRFWIETNWFEMTQDLWGNFQSGYFELIYLITVGVFGNTLLGQLSSQLIHFLFGQGLAAVLLFKYFSKVNKNLAAIAGLAVLTISKSGDFFLYAKNDGVLASFGLLVTMLVSDNNYIKMNEFKRSLLIGFLLGLIPAIKMSGLFLVAPLALYYTYIMRRNFKSIVIASTTALLVFSPILIRNYYFIGNPFFPGLISSFPGVLTEEMKTYYLYHMSSPLTFSTLLSAVKSFLTGKLFFLGIIPVVFMNLKQGKILLSTSLSLIVFLLYLFVNGGLIAERFFFICYFLMIFSIISFLMNKSLNKVSLVFLFLIIFADSKLDKSVKRIVNFFPKYISEPGMNIVHRESPLSLLWKGVPASEEKKLVLSDLFAQQFYAPKGIRIHQFRGRPDVEFLGKCSHTDLNKLAKFTYAILAENNQNPCYKKIRDEGTIINNLENFVLYKL